MKLLFSESQADYSNYIYPYAIWAFPEPGEMTSDFFNAGFLPSSRNLDRFYLGRQLRVRLEQFQPSSENRRILRKGEGLEMRLISRADYDFSAERRAFFKSYADAKWGKDVMTFERLDGLFSSPIVSHVLVFSERETGTEVGNVVLFLEGKEMAYYYYSFYDLNHLNRSLGMCMMTTAVKFFAEQGFRHVYLGTCYSQSALYKTQFPGIQFFNGFKWSDNIEELKHMVDRGHKEVKQHLLESEEYRNLFHEGSLPAMVDASRFQLSVSGLNPATAAK